MLLTTKQDQIPSNSFLISLLTYLIRNKLGPTNFFFFFFLTHYTVHLAAKGGGLSTKGLKDVNGSHGGLL